METETTFIYGNKPYQGEAMEAYLTEQDVAEILKVAVTKLQQDRHYRRGGAVQ